MRGRCDATDTCKRAFVFGTRMRIWGDTAEKICESITEQLKATDMIAWVQAMNCITNQAREIVNNEVIYTKFYNRQP